MPSYLNHSGRKQAGGITECLLSHRIIQNDWFEEIRNSNKTFDKPTREQETGQLKECEKIFNNPGNKFASGSNQYSIRRDGNPNKYFRPNHDQNSKFKESKNSGGTLSNKGRQPLQNNFCNTHFIVVSRSKEEVDSYRGSKDILAERVDSAYPILSFEEAGFPDNLKSHLTSQGLLSPTPIQAQGLPIATSGRNMVGVASTGSDKTLAHMLPSIVHIKNKANRKKGDGTIAFISAQARELAKQIKDVAEKYGAVSCIRGACVFGGSPKKETEHNTCTMKQITLTYLLTAVMIFLLSVVLVQLSATQSQSNLLADEWYLFKARHKKDYPSQLEEKFRMKIYVENKDKIAKHNILYEKGEKSYQVAMNQFGDLLHHEFTSIMIGYKKRTSPFAESTFTFMEFANVTVPESVDWREKGAVTPVKYQGQCASSWAFSSTGALESQTFRKTGKLISLSEQNLIDCSGEYGNLGCKGGWISQAFEYIKDNKGIDTENKYHYEAKENFCRDNPRNRGAVALGFVNIPSGEEDKLKAAVATVGPVSAVIDVSHEGFQFYSKGVYYEPSCKTSFEHLNHAVLVIGYGSDNGEDYWLVKNSWSKHWGDEGYLKIARNRKNHCGVATAALYPIV